MFADEIFPDQLLIEFDELHFPSFKSKRRGEKLFKILIRNGYVLVHRDSCDFTLIKKIDIATYRWRWLQLRILQKNFSCKEPCFASKEARSKHCYKHYFKLYSKHYSEDNCKHYSNYNTTYAEWFPFNKTDGWVLYQGRCWYQGDYQLPCRVQPSQGSISDFPWASQVKVTSQNLNTNPPSGGLFFWQKYLGMP